VSSVPSGPLRYADNDVTNTVSCRVYTRTHNRERCYPINFIDNFSGGYDRGERAEHTSLGRGRPGRGVREIV